MGARWNPIRFKFLCFLVLILGLPLQTSSALNDEGLALLELRSRLESDPFDALDDWNSSHSDPCSWSGVHCVAGNVEILDLAGLSLEGSLVPQLGELIHLRSLILNKNHFHGSIPKEIGGLTNLELLDLRENSFSGNIPAELGGLLSLKSLLLCDNNFEGSIPPQIGKLTLLSELQYDENLAFVAPQGVDIVNRKFGHKFKQGKDALHGFGESSSSEPQSIQNVEILANLARRRLLSLSSNLAGAPAANGSSSPIISLPTTLSSGAFPAVLTPKKNQSDPSVPAASPSNVTDAPSGSPGTTDPQHSDSGSSGKTWVYYLIIPIALVFILVVAGLIYMCHRQGGRTIGPWRTGLSGQLQKAFVTGVPKLNRPELEAACEDFSNIVETSDRCIAYKGTLSNGVEIAVASTSITSSKDWSKNAQIAYRKKIETLSRVNHKNFINLIGYCEEEEPFTRMMVFEYAPNGTLSEYLHVKEMDNLDWISRMRIIMGVAYCLQYMHHDLNPPVSHTNLTSHSIYLTDDYAAKIAEICFLTEAASKPKVSGNDAMEHSELACLADQETNVYNFGILMLEIISGKLPYSTELGPLEKWAEQYLRDERSLSYMIDPSIKSHKDNELSVVCEVIQECTQPNPKQRPSMRDVTSKLREVIGITPDQAIPRLSPLWWAELEILSVEAS